MSRTLNRTVLAGGSVLPAGTAWSEGLASIPERFWDGVAEATPVRVPEVPEVPEPVVPALSEPPRSGKGSGADVWRVYAEALGVRVDPDAGRDDIVAAIDEARD